MFHNHCDEHFHCDPHRRENPTYVGDVDTTQLGGIYDVQHMHGCCDPHCGYHIPTVPPLPPTFGCMTESEQIRDLSKKVNELCCLLEGHNHKIEDAYCAIVNSALCNSAYYKDITTEFGYIPESGSNYTVVHIPFLDKANEPIYFELGLAYDNTTNSGVKESCFDASMRFLADKLIPAQNKSDSFTGTVMWKGAPIYSNGGYTFAVTQNGFFKVYDSATADMLKADKIRNACGARGILVYNKALATEQFPEDAGTMKARVAVGQNYDTKERFIIVVDGGENVGCTSEQLANLFVKYGCMVATELASGVSSYGMNKGAMMYSPSVASEDDTPSVPESNAFWYITKRRHYHNDYVADVARLTQEVGQEIWRRTILNEQTDYVKGRIVELAQEIATERTERQDEDTRLDSKYSAEVVRIDEAIQTKERESKERDAQLQINIDNEVTARTENDVKKVAHVDDGNKRTYSVYRNNDTKIAEDIEVYEYNKLVATLQTLGEVAENLATEVSERKKADDALQAQITKEIADRTNANTELSAKITQEETERKTTDTQLGKDIESANTLITNLTSDLDETKTKLELETTNRKKEDVAINALIEAEQLARQNEDTALANQIKTLKTDYEAFKNDTSADLASKKTQIDNINADLANIKTVMDAQSTQMSSINATITAMQTVLATMETSLENMKKTIAEFQTSIGTANEAKELATEAKNTADSVAWVNKYRTLIEKLAAETV